MSVLLHFRTSFSGYGLEEFRCRSYGGGAWAGRGRGGLILRVRATQERDLGSKRLVDVVRRLPRIARMYFWDPFRRALFGGIAILGGFFVTQTISLRFERWV